MNSRFKIIATAIAAVLILSFGASTALALRSLELSNREIRGTSRALTFSGGGAEVICEVTLNGTANLRTPKRERTSAGSMQGAVNERGCRGGRARALGGIWPVLFLSFTGTLPNIRSARYEMLGAEFLISAFGGLGECLFRGNVQGTTGPNERITEGRVDERVQISLFRNLALFCPEEGSLRGAITLERTVIARLV